MPCRRKTSAGLAFCSRKRTVLRLKFTFALSHGPRTSGIWASEYDTGTTSNTGLSQCCGRSCCGQLAHGALSQFGSSTIGRDGGSVTLSGDRRRWANVFSKKSWSFRTATSPAGTAVWASKSLSLRADAFSLDRAFLFELEAELLLLCADRVDVDAVVNERGQLGREGVVVDRGVFGDVKLEFRRACRPAWSSLSANASKSR